MIKCSKCKGNTRITNTYNSLDGDIVVRRRVCKDCGKVIVTQEIIVEHGKENTRRTKKGG